MSKLDGRLQEALYSGRSAMVSEELISLREKHNFSNDMLLTVEKYYRTTSNAAYGDVLKVTSFVTHILEKLGYTSEEINVFFNKNRRIVLASYGNFVSKLAVFHQFDLLEPVITRHYIYLGSESNISSADLYALLSSGIKFDSLAELREIYDRMTLEDRKSLRTQYPLTKEMLKEFVGEMMSYVNVVQGITNLRKLMEQRRAQREGSM